MKSFFALVLVALMTVPGFAEDIYVVNTPSGQQTYSYPPVSPANTVNMPVVKTNPGNTNCTESDLNGGWACNFVSNDDVDQVIDAYKTAGTKEVEGYRVELQKKLDSQDNPPETGVIPELIPLSSQVDKALDEANGWFKKNEEFAKAERAKVWAKADALRLKEGDPRFKIPAFNRMLMAENPQLDKFAALRILNGLSTFPHGVSLPSQPLMITSGEYFSFIRTAINFTPIGIGLSAVEAMWGRELTPPFDRLSTGQRGFQLAAAFVANPKFWNKAAQEVGSLTGAFKKYFGVGVVDSGATAFFEEINASSALLEGFNPVNPGVLETIPIGTSGQVVSDFFRSATYFKNTLATEVKLYRVYSPGLSQLGPFYSRVKPTGPLQAMTDAALHPNWGNQATHWVEITVPPGEVIYEGMTSTVKIGALEVLGGGTQAYVPKKVPTSWITASGQF